MRRLVRTGSGRIIGAPTEPSLAILGQTPRGQLTEPEFRKMLARVIKLGDGAYTGQDFVLEAPHYHTKYRIALYARPKRILEIGVRAGYSAWAFLRACPGAEYYGIDAYNGTSGGGVLSDGFKEWAEQLIALTGCSHFQVRVMDSHCLRSLPPADLYHVDGDHSYEGAKHDITTSYISAPAGSVILVDDYDFLADVRLAFEDCCKIHGLDDCAAYVPSYRGEGLIFKARRVPHWVYDLGGKQL